MSETIEEQLQTIPEVELIELMQKYATEINEMDVECHNVNEDISRLVEIRDSLLKPHQESINKIVEAMKPLMFERKASFICSRGKIEFRKGAVRRTWNLDALDQICDARTEIRNAIWPFRTEKVGEPSISVKLGDSK